MAEWTRESWLEAYLKPLVGAEIVSVGTFDDGAGLWPVLNVKTKDGQTVKLEISQDEEGNGPGFIYGLPDPPPDQKE